MYNKRSYGIMPRSFGFMLDDLLQNSGLPVHDEFNIYATPVNVLETDKEYELHVYAPGIKKEDIKVSLDKNLLSISYDHKDESQEREGKWISKEYRHKSFKRTFTLHDKIDGTKITAKYNEGILVVSLPKKELVETTVKEVAIN